GVSSTVNVYVVIRVPLRLFQGVPTTSLTAYLFCLCCHGLTWYSTTGSRQAPAHRKLFWHLSRRAWRSSRFSDVGSSSTAPHCIQRTKGVKHRAQGTLTTTSVKHGA